MLLPSNIELTTIVTRTKAMIPEIRTQMGMRVANPRLVIRVSFLSRSGLRRWSGLSNAFGC
jgi:hypothetical protein